MKSWGLVLSGGSAWGIANIGILEVLEKEGLRPDFVAGSSMGAIVGSLYALGYSTEALRDIAKSLKMRKAFRLARRPLRGGLHAGILSPQLRPLLGELVGSKKISDCSVPFLCVAGKVKSPILWRKIMRSEFTDHVLEQIEPVVFAPNTKIIDAILASSALPVVFTPVTVEEVEYIDLVHFGSVPVLPMKKQWNPDVIIATDTNSTYRKMKRYVPPRLKQIIERGQQTLDKNRKAADLVIQPEITLPIFRFDRADDFIEAGRIAAKKMLPQIRKLLK